MPTFLVLGFLIGLRHALDADHVAAVATLATRGGSLGTQVRQGALWGLGHTLTLLLVAGACVLLGVAVPAGAERGFEALVGAMLVLLGLSVLCRPPGEPRARTRGRALLIGGVHGLAGSGALVLLTSSVAPTPLAGLAHVGLFGLGSILGMSALAAALAIPLGARPRLPLGRFIHPSVGAASVLLGARILWLQAG